MFRLSKRSKKRIEGIEPVLKKILNAAIKNSPFDFGIPQYGGLRTAEDQNALFMMGRKMVNGKAVKVGAVWTNCDGYKKRSYHQSGWAFDIYAYINGKASWEAKYYTPIARHIQKIAKEKFNVNLKWGGDWKRFKDMPHFEIS